uniref:Putative site-specific DNA endonuclease n=1 Tax=Oltmannsiellopsis viridis TaxID=51324 RepID=Q0QIR3_OLTVI|nr:putative site-specific DNA endonuclease [Oltmannsiellopsis viridis]ABC96340.1 putative site-specific DNA endonuclease [Oltmannsiellopsis viridis]
MKLDIQKLLESLDQETVSVLTGLILGDASCESRSLGTARFQFKQESSNVEYLMKIHKFLAKKKIVNPSKPKLRTRVVKNSKVRFYYRLNTFTRKSLFVFYKGFYIRILNSGRKQHVKIIPENIIEVLDLKCLATWFMGDGSVGGSHGLKLATNSFYKTDVIRLSEALNTRHGFNTTVQRDGKQYIIYFPSRDVPEVQAKIKDLMVSSMHYKLRIKV